MDRERLSDLAGHYLKTVEQEWAFLRVGEASLPLERVFFMLQARERPEPGPMEPPRPELDPGAERLKAAGLPGT